MRRLALLGAVLLGLAVIYVIAWRTQPGAGPSAGTAETGQAAMVTSVTRSCPPAAPGAGSGHIAMIAVPAQTPSGQSSAAGAAAAVPAGTAAVSAIPAAAPASGSAGPATAGQPSTTPSAAKTAAKTAGPVAVSAPDMATMVTAPDMPGVGGSAVAATGQMAEGFEAEQADSAGTGLVSCTHPSSDMWFVGTGQGAGAPDIRLYLMNTGTLSASVDLTILTDAGQQNGLSSAITVAPDQALAEDIAPYARGSQALALHVQTSSGQVAAAVWEGDAAGGAWLPQAAAPATTLVIPGLTVASSSARLFVAVPGSAEASLKLVAYTPAGAFPQFAATPVDASSGATTPVTLSSLGASAAGLKLTSNVPIVAGVLIPGKGVGSFTAAVPPLAGQGVVAGNPTASGVTVGLLLTAPSAPARASVSVVAANGSVTSPAGLRSVLVRPGHTLAVAVPGPPGRQPFSIVITPEAGSGPLYAARVVTSGTGGLSAPLASLLPVPSALASITLPPVRNSYTAVLP